MQLDYYQVDAFTTGVFKGNPAGVVPLYEWLSDELMQNIAMENNLSETAFFVKKGEYYELRWFTPESEVNLCGHATLASAHIIYNHLGYPADEAVVFHTKSGRLFVDQAKDHHLSMDFPAWQAREIQVTERVWKALGAKPDALYAGDRDMMAVFEDEAVVRSLRPDFRKVAQLDCICCIATAPSMDYDFISRTFVPEEGIPEDPVTGSAHCTLVPYWAERLGKREMRAFQASARGGELFLGHDGDRVTIAGNAITYLVGTIHL